MVSIKKAAAVSVYFLFQFTWMTVAQVLLTEIFSSKRSTDSNIWFANILILLLFPELVMMMYDVWMSNIIALKRYQEWPEIKILINGVVISIIDAMGLGYLTTVGFPVIPPFLLPGIFCIGLSPANHLLAEKEKESGNLCSGRKCLLPIFQFLLLISVTTSLVFCGIMNIENASFFGLSLLMLNLTRSTPLQNHIFGTDNKNAKAQNAGILYRFLRIVILVLSVYIAFLQDNDDHSLSTFFVSITNDTTVLKVTMVCACVLLGQIDSYIPTLSSRKAILSTITCFCTTLTVSIFVLYVYFVDNNFKLFENIKSFPVSFSMYHIILYSCTCLSVLSICFATFYYIYKGKFCIRLCRLVFYDNIFSCQNLIIRRLCKPKCFKESKRSRVFVCSTMYQESVIEMRRLLCSLKKISASKVLKDRNVYIESHIFLDNGANEMKVKSFGIQLLALIGETFKLEEKYETMVNTPYGIRFSWNVPGQTPLFLHLKDSSLVKAKKRWSQIMYIKYILQYREKEQLLFQKAANPVNSVYSVPLNFVDAEVDVTPNVLRSESNAKSHTFTNAYSTSSMKSLLRVPSATQLAEQDNEREGAIRSSDSAEYNLSGDRNQEITLRVPMSHFTTKKRRSSFDHSFISQKKSSATKYCLDSHLQNKLCNDFSRPSFHSSFFCDKEHRKKDILVDEINQDFILATDSDMAFDDQSILNLLETIEKDNKIGGVCGRTVPISVRSHPIVWLQKFEYAKDFFMGKSAQNIIGSVMCCPGCFSLFRFEALHDCIDTYSMPTSLISDVFTKDSGEDRWICTLMMNAGWTLKYSCHGYNSTFCPEETEEFMKQRRRWLLSDFANTVIVAKNLLHLMKNNTAFTVLYTLYFLQLSIVTILCPGSTLLMLSFLVKLVAGIPLIVNAAVLWAICLAYCIVQISSLTAYKKLVLSKLLTLVLGILTTYVFVATSVYIVQMVIKDKGFLFATSHIAILVLLGVIFLHLYAILLHPFDIHLLLAGIVYLFYIPFVFIFIQLYAVCNIVDQTWGTRDNQNAVASSFLHFPKFRKQKKSSSLKDRENAFKNSAIDLQDISENEALFWQNLVNDCIGVGVNPGILQEDRAKGLRSLRTKATIAFLSVNFLWVAIWIGMDALLMKFFMDRLLYGLILFCLFCVPICIQILGMTVYRFSDILTQFGRLMS